MSVDPDAVRQSAESGAIGNLSTTASIIGFDVPDVEATLDRLIAAMDRHIGDVALTGADSAVGEGVINLTLEAVGGTHSVDGVSDVVVLGLEMADPELVPISRTLYDNTGANTINWDGVAIRGARAHTRDFLH